MGIRILANKLVIWMKQEEITPSPRPLKTHVLGAWPLQQSMTADQANIHPDIFQIPTRTSESENTLLPVCYGRVNFSLPRRSLSHHPMMNRTQLIIFSGGRTRSYGIMFCHIWRASDIRSILHYGISGGQKRVFQLHQSMLIGDFGNFMHHSFFLFV